MTTVRDNDYYVWYRIPRFQRYCPYTVAQVLLSRATFTVCRDLVGHFLRRRVNYRRTSHTCTFFTSLMFILAFTCSYHYDSIFHFVFFLSFLFLSFPFVFFCLILSICSSQASLILKQTLHSSRLNTFLLQFHP